MSGTEYFTGRRYEIVAFAHGEKPIYYEEFLSGDVTAGSWLLVTRGEEHVANREQFVLAFPVHHLGPDLAHQVFLVYRGEIGYCCPSHRNDDAFCREFEREFGDFDPQRTRVTRQRALQFVHRYNLNPLLEIPVATMRRLCEEGTLVEALPANFRSGSQWAQLPPPEQAALAIITAAKIEMGWPLVVQDVLEMPNQELRARALDVFGKERLVREAGAEVVDQDGENELLQVGSMLFAHVQDASTPRRYLLRVPPRIQTVREAIAWTFGFNAGEDYRPIKET